MQTTKYTHQESAEIFTTTKGQYVWRAHTSPYRGFSAPFFSFELVVADARDVLTQFGAKSHLQVVSIFQGAL